MFYEGRVLVTRVWHFYRIICACLYFCAFYSQNTRMYTGGHIRPFTCSSSKSMKCILMKFVIWGWHLKFSGTRVVDIATWQQTGQPGVRILAGVKAFLFSKTSRLALGPTQPPIQWVLGLFPGIKCLVPRLTLDSWLGKYCPINLNVLACKGQRYSTIPCIFKISASISTGLFFHSMCLFFRYKDCLKFNSS